MQNRKNCPRCGGRMFLEFDYDSRRYDFVCISCGRVEQTVATGAKSQSNGTDRQSRQEATLTHV